MLAITLAKPFLLKLSYFFLLLRVLLLTQTNHYSTISIYIYKYLVAQVLPYILHMYMQICISVFTNICMYIFENMLTHVN